LLRAPGKGTFDMQEINQGAPARKRVLACNSCGKKIVHRAGRRPRFCSIRCKEKARTRVRKASLGRDTGAPAKLQKKNKKFKALQRAKMLSSRRILAPADVLTVEVWGDRKWRPAISSGGVPIEIGRLRERALVSS
jgi:hypothetical protein